MPKRLLLLDFDRTLFDTATFFDEIWRFVAQEYGIDDATEKVRAPEFFDMYGTAYDYRFFDHLQSAIGEKFERSTFEAESRLRFSDVFLFTDVTDEMLGKIDAIVTFGSPDYQNFKLALCPRLTRIPRHIIQIPKGQYIAQTFKEPTLLIDDKRLEDEILPPARFVRIDRTLQESSMVTGVISTLKDLERNRAFIDS